MPNAALVLALALAAGPTTAGDGPYPMPARASGTTLGATQLERRMAERGPIRARLDAVRARPLVELSEDALDASLKQARHASAQGSGSSGWAWGLAAVFALVFCCALWLSSLEIDF